MAEAKQIVQYNTFVAGLITEATELTFPPNATKAEDNCVLYAKGNRTRRRGADFEAGYQIIDTGLAYNTLPNIAISGHEWLAVNGIGTLNFGIVQVGATLYFFNMAGSVLSAGLKSFTVNLNSYLAPAAATAAGDEVSVTVGSY